MVGWLSPVSRTLFVTFLVLAWLFSRRTSKELGGSEQAFQDSCRLIGSFAEFICRVRKTPGPFVLGCFEGLGKQDDDEVLKLRSQHKNNSSFGKDLSIRQFCFYIVVPGLFVRTCCSTAHFAPLRPTSLKFCRPTRCFRLLQVDQC